MNFSAGARRRIYLSSYWPANVEIGQQIGIVAIPRDRMPVKCPGCDQDA